MNKPGADLRVTEPFSKVVDAPVGDFDEETIKRFVPAAGTVLIKVDDPKKLTEGGLHIPESAQEEPCTGVVVAGINFEEGVRVLFPPYIGVHANFMGHAGYKILRVEGEDPEILGIFTPPLAKDG